MFNYTLIFLVSVTSFVEPCLGQVRFSKLFGFPPPYADASFCPAVEVPGDGYLFPYNSWNYQTGETSIVLQKINYTGDTVWKKKYGKPEAQFDPHFIINTNDQNYAVAGYYFELTDTTMYFYLLKVKPNGDSLWSRKYPPITKARAVNANMVKQTGDRGYILCGYRQPFDNSNNALAADIYVVKTDSLGYMQWNKQFGGSGHDVATSVIETADKGFLIGGYTSASPSADNDTYLLRIDSLGKVLWDSTYGELGYNDGINRMIYLKDGNYLLAGEINYNSPGPNNGKAMIIKITPNGTIIWKKKYGGMEMTTLNDVIELPNGDVVATGGNNNTPYYNQAGWMMKANANGDSLWARIYDYIPGYPSIFWGIKATSDNGFLLTGAAQDTIVSKTQQAWVLKLDSMGCDVAGCQFVGIKEQQQLNGSINVFPNPSNGSFMVKSEMLLKKCVVVDILGNIVYSEDNIQLSSISISLSQLSNGIYFLKVTDVGDKEQVSKIIIEQ